jgi:fibronectin type 3 domain-containing protein
MPTQHPLSVRIRIVLCKNSGVIARVQSAQNRYFQVWQTVTPNVVRVDWRDHVAPRIRRYAVRRINADFIAALRQRFAQLRRSIDEEVRSGLSLS